MSFVQHLRRGTAADHQAIDDTYGRFRLDDADDYRRFLTSQARALPAVERALASDEGLPRWRARAALLAADLAGMGVSMPVPLDFDPDTGDGTANGTGASRWGALYVIEGSRLGGQLLARSVPADRPRLYLSARHEPGEWRALLAALDERAGRADDGWRAAALSGARATFALYARAASPPL